jgi:class 3 adenylate cyclase
MTGELGTRKGEVRRLTFMYCDVVGSTALSGRLELETYHELMRAYRTTCREVIESRFEGHIVHFKGDGLLAAFGFPIAHENDAERAVRAGLALVRAVRDRSLELASSYGESLEVRVAVHRGPVFVDFGDDDISGLPANVGSRFDATADPGTVVVSEEVRQLVADHFEIEAGRPQMVKGVAEPLQPFRVTGERTAPARRSWSTPLVERDSELERLAQAYARVASGDADSPTGILLHGEAGVGKTRLVAALLDQAANGPVVDLHGSPFHGEVGFHPVRRLIEARCNISDDDSPAARLECLTHDVTELGLDPAATVPLLAPVADIDPRAGYDQAPTEGRMLEEQVTQAVLDYTMACLQGRPGIIVAENLHWFDRATSALLEKLLWVGAGTVLIVATSRNLEPGPWEAIELRPLSLAGRYALVDALEQGVTDEDRHALATRSGGIPLYLEELVRAGERDQRTPGAAAPVPGSVPEVLYEPLVARLYATPSAIPVAATAAAAGQEVDRSLLAATMSMPAASLDSTLRALVDARVLETIQGRSERYQFRHELLREVAYELQPPSWRREVHSRLCDLLAEEESRDWHVLASHFERAERHSEAAAAYQETAELARRRGALSEARTHLTRAIDLVLPLGADVARDHLEVQLRLRRGFLAMSQEGAGSAQASADFDRCLELAASDPHGDDMLSTLISLWAYYLSRAELDRARWVTTTLRDTLGKQPETLRPTNLAGSGMLDWFAGDFTTANEELTAAVGALDKSPSAGNVEAVWFVPNNPFVAMYVHLALARFMAGDPAGADESLVRARKIAASLDFPQGPWSAAYAIWLGSWTWIEAGRLEPAEQSLAELESLCARHGLDSWGLIAATQTAALEGIRALRSDSSEPASLVDCAQLLGSLLDIWRAVELRVFLPFYLTTAGALLAAAGDSEAARGRYEESLALSAETGMRFYDAETMRCLAQLAADRAEAVAGLRSALDLARAQGAHPFEERIELDLRALSAEEARSLG